MVDEATEDPTGLEPAHEQARRPFDVDSRWQRPAPDFPVLGKSQLPTQPLLLEGVAPGRTHVGCIPRKVHFDDVASAPLAEIQIVEPQPRLLLLALSYTLVISRSAIQPEVDGTRPGEHR